jgi:hypothetical protein
MNIVSRVLLAIDQGACLLLTGQNDFTLSGWSYLRKVQKGKPFCNNAVNAIFFWEKNHCANALIWEVNSAEAILREYHKEREEAREECNPKGEL